MEDTNKNEEIKVDSQQSTIEDGAGNGADTPSSGFHIKPLFPVVTEGDAGESNIVTFTVYRNVEIDSHATLSFRAAVEGGAPATLPVFERGQDMLRDNGGDPSGEISFAPGETKRNVSLQLAGDDVVEPDQQIQVVLFEQAEGVEVPVDRIGISILDDDTSDFGGSGNDGSDEVFELIFAEAVNRYEHDTAGGIKHFMALDHSTNGARQMASDKGLDEAQARELAEAVREALITRFELTDVLAETGEDPFAGPFSEQADSPFVARDNSYRFEETEVVKPEFVYSDTIPDKHYYPDAPPSFQPEPPVSPTPPVGPPTVAPLPDPNPETQTVEIFTSQEITEGEDGPVTIVYFRIVRSDGAGNAGVDWSITSGSLSAADFEGGVIPSGSVTFADGETEKIISVRIVDDSIAEGDEDLTITLSNPTGNLEIGEHDSVDLIVHDNEVGYHIYADQPTALEDAEGNQVLVTFTVTRTSSPDQEATISYQAVPFGAQSVSLDDFVAGQDDLGSNGGFPSGSVTFAPGETEKQISIYLDGDNYVASDEEFAVRLFDQPPGELIYTGIASMQVLNDDAVVNISTTTPTLQEGDTEPATFVFTVTRTGSLLSETQVDYNVGVFGESPAQPSDLVGNVFPSGTIYFAAGQAEATITVQAAPDSLVESNEQFFVELLNPGDNLEIGNGAVLATIGQDDAAVRIKAVEGDTFEGNGIPFFQTFEISRGANISEETVVNWTVQAGGANPAQADDFAGGTWPSGTVTFAPGETVKTITVFPDPDLVYEETETYEVVLSLPNPGAVLLNASAPGSIITDESGVSITASHLTLEEGNSGSTVFDFVVSRVGKTDVESSVDWALSPGSVDGVSVDDFPGSVFPSGTINFAPGELQKTVSFEVAADSAVEADENFTVTLSNPNPGTSIVVGEADGQVVNDDSLISIEAVDLIKHEGQTGITEFTFRVIREADTSGTVTVAYSVSGSGANSADGDDFFGGSLPSGTVVFNPGETEQLVTIQISGDNQFEADESFTVTLSNPSSGAQLLVGGESASSTIQNDDDAFSIVAVDTEVVEGGDNSGGTITFRIDRDYNSDTVSSVRWTISGSVDGDDFSQLTDVVTFAVGEESKTIQVPITGDYFIENNEDFTVTLSEPSVGSAIEIPSIDGTVINDDTGLSIAAVTTNLDEGDTGTVTHTFVVTRSGITTEATTVEWSVVGSGLNEADEDDFGGSFPSGTISFAPGETSQVITVTTTGDTDIESNETFAVILGSVNGNTDMTTASAEGSIVADDIAISITAEQTLVVEGSSPNTQILQFTVSRSGDVGSPVSVDWTASGLSAADFAAGTTLSGNVDFASGETSKTINLVLKGENIMEPDETLTVTLTNPATNPSYDHTYLITDSAQTTVINDDVALTIVADTPELDEGEPVNTDQTPFTFTITRTGDLDRATEINWNVTSPGGDSSANTDDFTAGQNLLGSASGLPSGTVSFAAGEVSKQVTVMVSTDDLIESDESFAVELSGADGYTEIVTPTAAAIIANDDVGFTLEAVSATLEEGDSGNTYYTFEVSRSGNTDEPGSVDWSVTGSGSDIADPDDFDGGTYPSGTLNFAAGETSIIISIPVLGDLATENDEGFSVTISNALSGGVSQPIVVDTVSASILNDDQQFSVNAPDSVVEGSSGQTTQVVFTVVRNGDIAEPATIDYTVEGSNGADLSDIAGAAFPSGTLSFGAGVGELTVTVDVSHDTIAESDEALILTLTNPSDGTIATGSATTTIVNDDTNYALVAPANIYEGHTGATTPYTFTVTRVGDTSAAGSVIWRVAATAGLTTADFIAGQDLLGNDGLPSGTVLFAAGETSKDITINVQGDTTLENDEILEVTISAPVNGTITTATQSATILTDDDSFAITAETTSLDEGNVDTTITYTVTRSGSLVGDRDLTWTISGIDGFDPATDLVDGQPATGTISFSDGQSVATIEVTVKGDSVVEGDETMTVTLTNPPDNTVLSNSSVSTILVNDDAGLSIAPLQAVKPEGSLPFQEGEVPGDISSVFTVSSAGTVSGEIGDFGSGGADQDFYKVYLEAGHSYQIDHKGNPTGDGTLSDPLFEGVFDSSGTLMTGTRNDDGGSGLNSQVVFTPSESGVYYLSAGSFSSNTGTYTLEIADLTDPGSDVSFTPTNPYTFTITRSGDLDQISTVEWRVGGGTTPVDTDDFLTGVDQLGDNGGLPSGTVTFAAGEDSITLTIDVISDSILEADEDLQVTLSNPSVGTEIITASAIGQVQNDDAELNITAGTASRVEGDGLHSTAVAYTYTVTRTGNLDQVTTADWNVVHGTTSLADFTNGTETNITPSGTVTFAVGETTKEITVYVYGDTGAGSYEGDETFSVQLSNPNPGNSIGTNDTFTSTIVDDDTMLLMTVDDYSKAEGSAGETTDFVYTVTRAGNLDTALSYDWQTTYTDPSYSSTSSTADVYDYLDSRYEYNVSTNDFVGGTFQSGTGGFAIGETTDTFTVSMQGDDYAENDEWFITQLTASGDIDEVRVLYDDPDQDDGTLLFRSRYSPSEYYRDNETYSSEETGISDNNSNYMWSSIERDEAIFYLSDREVADETVQTLAPGDGLYRRNEGDSIPDGGTGVISITIDGVEYAFLEHIFAVQRQITQSGEASVDWQVATYYADSVEADDFVNITRDTDGNIIGVETSTDLPSGTVTFEDGQEWGYLKFYTNADDVGEFDESFSVYLTNPSAGSSVYGLDDSGDRWRNSGWLVNDDTRFDAEVNDVEEGGVLTYTIYRTGDTRGTDTVDWAITFPGSEATNESNTDTSTWYDADPTDVLSVTPEEGSATYDATSRQWSGTLTFEDGETEKTITVVTGDDTWTETWREELPIALGNAQNVDAGEANHDLETASVGYTDTAWIYDNEADPLISATVSATEVWEGSTGTSSSSPGNSITYTVTRTDLAGNDGSLDYPTIVSWSLTGSSNLWSYDREIMTVTGDDVVLKRTYRGTTQGNITFEAGETSKEITVTFRGDYDPQVQQDLTFSLIDPEDAMGTYWSQDMYGPANIDPDFEPLVTTLKNDDIRLEVFNTGRGTANTNNFEMYEGEDGVFKVYRSGRIDTDVEVQYTIINGTTEDGDLDQRTGTFTLEAQADTDTYGGYTYTVNLADLLVDDTLPENIENFTLQLSAPSDSEGSAVRFATSYNEQLSDTTTVDVAVTVHDDDFDYTLTPLQTELVETDSGSSQTFSFDLTRSNNSYTGPTTLWWRLEPVGTDAVDATDFLTTDALGTNGGLPSGVVNFNAGETATQFSVQVNGDSAVEANEGFRIVVYQDILTGVTPNISNDLALASADLTIINDDTGIMVNDATITESDTD